MVFAIFISASTQTATKNASQVINPLEDFQFTTENSNKLICATTYFGRYRSWAVRQYGDKFKHCALSCMVARRCPHWEVEVVGVLKEVMDIFGPGNAEVADHLANRQGIRFSSMTKDDSDCVRFCRQVY